MFDDLSLNARSAPMTRDERVREEGTEAARRGLSAMDNPYRSGSADGTAWRRGLDLYLGARIPIAG